MKQTVVHDFSKTTFQQDNNPAFQLNQCVYRCETLGSIENIAVLNSAP